MNITGLSANQLSRAAAIKEQMEKLQQELSSILGTGAPAAPAAAAAAAPKKFTMSASAKAAISKAAKARWAKIKAAKKK